MGHSNRSTLLMRLQQTQDGTHDQNLAAHVEALIVEVEAAVEELRTLAHGIYPPLLRQDSSLRPSAQWRTGARDAIRVADEGIGRCPAPIETAIYFCSLEAIQNAMKHAGSHARVIVTLGRDDGGVHFTSRWLGNGHPELGATGRACWACATASAPSAAI